MQSPFSIAGEFSWCVSESGKKLDGVVAVEVFKKRSDLIGFDVLLVFRIGGSPIGTQPFWEILRAVEKLASGANPLDLEAMFCKGIDLRY